MILNVTNLRYLLKYNLIYVWKRLLQPVFDNILYCVHNSSMRIIIKIYRTKIHNVAFAWLQQPTRSVQNKTFSALQYLQFDVRR